MLEISKTFENGKAVIALDGKLDTRTAPDLKRELPLGDSSVKELVIDFEKLIYISSAGLRMILLAFNDMKNRGSFRLTHVSTPIIEIFEMTGLTNELTIERA